MDGSRTGQPNARRDIAIATAILVAAGLLLLTGTSADGDESADSTADAYLDAEAGIAATIPSGWHVVARPLDAILYPPQVLAAASFPLTAPARPSGCTPREAIGRMPPGGAMLQVLEYAPLDSLGEAAEVPEMPAAPERFSYAEAERGSFECADRSYRFAFERGGRAFQAQVWLDPVTVEPGNRAKALRILDGFRAVAG